jgi:hypothetical protein
MMNRIFKYTRAKRRKIAIQPVCGMPANCSFCGKSLSQSHLNAASKLDNVDGTGPLAAICAFCIERLAPLCRLMHTYQQFYRLEKNLWPELSMRIHKHLATAAGDVAIKKTVVQLLVRLLRRTFSILVGYRANGYVVCPRSGVSLAPPRIAIIYHDPDACVHLIASSAEAVGLPTCITSEIDVVLGDAVYRLARDGCNGDPVLASIGLLVIREFLPVSDDVAVVYALESSCGLPAEIEIIRVSD